MSLLVDDNKRYPEIQWDTPIHQLIRDDFVLENKHATHSTTIEDALSHRSGFAGHDRALGGPGCTVQSIVRNMRHLPMSSGPRTKYQYSNTMYVVATHIIQTVTGRKLGDLMREWIWEPLGMSSTFFDLESAKGAKEHLAHGYKYLYESEDGGFDELEWMVVDDTTSGAGAIISNVLDYSKWVHAILNKSTPLSPKGAEEIFTPRTLMLPLEDAYTGPRSYALGWRIGVYHGHRIWEHTGGMIGFGAHVMVLPDIHFGVVAMANTSGTANNVAQTLVFHLLDEKLKIPLENRYEWNKR